MGRVKDFYKSLLFHQYYISNEALGLYRILFVLVYIVLLGIPSFSWIQSVPDIFYMPQKFNIARIYALEKPSEIILLILDFAICIFFALILFGIRTRKVSIILSLLLLAGYSLKFSTGKIGHNIFLVITPFVMAFSGWGNQFTLDRNEKVTENFQRNAYIVFLMAFILGFAMSTSAASKILGGWLDPEQYGTFYHFQFRYNFWVDKQSFLAPLFAKINNLSFWKSLDYITVFFELLFLPAVLNKKLFQYFCVAAVIFHLATYMIFNIPYVNNLIIYLLFIPWEKLIDYLSQKDILKIVNRLINWKNLFIVASYLLIQEFLFIFIWNTNLSEDKLISPLSFLSLFTSYDIRDWRAWILLSLSLTVILLLVGVLVKQKIYRKKSST